MNKVKYLDIIKQNWQTIAITVLGVVVLSLVFSLVQPLEYRSRVDLLIIQKQDTSMDSYAAARAAEKIAQNLGAVIETQSFFEKVIANSNLLRSDFPSNENDLRKAWSKKITTSVVSETSILRIDVYDTNKTEANKIAAAVSYTLSATAQDYHGAGNNISVKVVNEPLVSNHPVRPNIVLNLLAGLLVGLILSLTWIFYQTNKSLNQLEQEINQNSDTPVMQSYNESQENIFKPQIKTMYDNL